MNNPQAIYRGYGLTLNIPESVLEIWHEHKQVHESIPERFGVIIGSRSAGCEEYWIDSVTTPAPNDRATRHSFLLQDKSHQDAVDQAFRASGGTSIYLGTWHSHPEYYPNPSSIDQKDWGACVKRNSGRKLFFVIVGITEIRIYVRRNWLLGFAQLKKDN